MSRESTERICLDLADGFRKTAGILIEQARRLEEDSKPEVAQALIRRAVSTLYYSVFHLIAKSCADAFIPDKNGIERAWLQVYRYLDHGRCLNACRKAEDKKIPFPEEVMDTMTLFIKLKGEREEADYNPNRNLEINKAVEWEEDTSKAYEGMKNVIAKEEKHLRAFASWILIETKNRHNSNRDSSLPEKHKEKNNQKGQL